MTELPLTSELLVLGFSVVLLFVHIMLQGRLATRERGLEWNAGPRDGEMKPLGPKAGRAAVSYTHLTLPTTPYV